MNNESETTDKENSGTAEKIAQCAYYIWEQEGQPEGRSLEHWRRAEVQIRGGNSAPAGAETPDERAST